MNWHKVFHVFTAHWHAGEEVTRSVSWCTLQKKQVEYCCCFCHKIKYGERKGLDY